MNAMRHLNAHPQILCDLSGVKAHSRVWSWLFLSLLLGSALALGAETNGVSTNTVAASSHTNHVSAHSADENATTKDEPETKPAPTSGKLDYSSFKTVVDRNIFNGNRSGQRMTATRSSTQQRSVRVESFTLVGTLISDHGSTAFFDGSSSELRKSLKAGSTIAGFTVKEILHAGIRLVEGTNTLDLRVGSGMRREDEGLWKSAAAGNYASTSSSSSSTYSSRQENNNNGGRNFARNGGGRAARTESNSSSETTSAPPSADVDAVLKRLMEQREKE